MDPKTFITTYKNIVSILAVVLVIFAFLLSKIIPSIINISKINKDCAAAKVTLADKERRLKDLKEKLEESGKDKLELVKQFYKSIDKGLDTEAVIANEFAEVLVILRSHSIKARSVEYEYDPKDDNFVKNVGNEYSAARLRIQMIGTYKNYEAFLKELFKHEHFIDIESIEIVPYEKNKRILLVNMQLKLYAQKN